MNEMTQVMFEKIKPIDGEFSFTVTSTFNDTRRTHCPNVFFPFFFFYQKETNKLHIS